MPSSLFVLRHMNTATIVQKLWNYCNVLRDDCMSYGDYVKQLTYLLFLKMTWLDYPGHTTASEIIREVEVVC